MAQLLIVFLLSALASADDSGSTNTCRQRGDCVTDGHDRVDLMQKDITLRSGRSSHMHTEKIQSLGLSNQSIVVKRREETTILTTTLDPTGVTLNGEGDLTAFVSATLTNTIGVIVLFLVFGCLRQRYPCMLLNNEIAGIWPVKTARLDGVPTFWGWWEPTKNLDPTEVAKHIGLDQAMMLKFCNLCMEILAIVGIPMLCVMGPMHWIFGGCAGREELKELACHGGVDNMSYLSFGNVRNGSWLYYIHGCIVWGVVLTVQNRIKSYMTAFLPVRQKWLKEMAEVRANTILVEDIPEDHQSDALLQEFFQNLLPNVKVKEAIMVKDTSALLNHVKTREGLRKQLKEAVAKWENAKETDKAAPRPTVREGWSSERVDLFVTTQKKIADETKLIEEARKEVEKEAEKKSGVNLSCGFVTFAEARDAQLALHLSGAVSADTEDWSIMTPPSPEDIKWNDLTQDQTANAGRTMLGWALVAGLGFAYMPLVICVTNLANNISLCEGVLEPLCPLDSVWKGLAPTMGLTIMVAFLPTFIILIFQFCFTLRADQWAQHKLQIWYFWFQVVFVLLATAVGQDFNGFILVLSTEPFSIFMQLADTMPYATHFYMNYLVLQWLSHTMNLTRYVPVMKFKAFGKLYDDEDARRMAEPEDQDYYGQGGRTSRWTIMMLIGIVFGTLSPPMNLLAFMNFALCKVVYGYLYAFAETKKPDLGGVFFVTQLEHLFWGLVLYCILMTGVLYQRAYNEAGTVMNASGVEVSVVADSYIQMLPAVMSAAAIGYSRWALGKFRSHFSWECLPMMELIKDKDEKTVTRRTNDIQYRQPELLPDVNDEIDTKDLK